MKKILSTLTAAICVLACMFSFTACDNGDNGNTHTTHNWSATYTQDGDRHYQTCDGCNEKNYASHNYVDGVCVCGKQKDETHTTHNWSKTYTQDGDRHYQTCNGCTEKNYASHNYVDGVCVCGKQKPEITIAVESVTLNKNEITLTIEATETLTATVMPDSATDKAITWTSDKPAIASVDNSGKITALSAGTAIITATAGGKSANCTVTVNDDTNAFAEIIKTCKALTEKGGRTNVEILTVLQDAGGYLTYAFKADKGYGKYTTDIEIDTTIESVKAVDLNALAKSNIYVLDVYDTGVYNTDGTADDKQMVESMIAKLLGDGYTVIYGTVTATADRGTTTGLGDAASFGVYALLEKDGRIFEYSETVTATKNYGDVYQAVLNSTEANKSHVYKDNGKVPTDLGDVAALYWAECQKEQQTTTNQ